MKLLLVEKNKTTRPLVLFLESISGGLHTKIYNKFQSYAQHDGVYPSKSLKTLNSKIWNLRAPLVIRCFFCKITSHYILGVLCRKCLLPLQEAQQRR
jgi:hypothetical protein